MNYFDIYFQGKSSQQILNKNYTPEFEKDYNTAGVKPYFQSLYNEIFKLWIKEKIASNKNLYDKEFKVISKADFPNLSDNDFKISKDFVTRTESLYLANWIYEEEYENHGFKLFDFAGIIKALDKMEENPIVFFINKHSIIKIINTYLFGKWIDYYLREKAPTRAKRKYESESKHYFEIILNQSINYTLKEIDTINDSPTITANKSASNAYWQDFKELMRSFKSFLDTAEPQEFKEDCLVKCIYDYRGFRVEVLSEISKYIITFEELQNESKLFTMTHKKRLLLYELLRFIEPQKKLPLDMEAYRDTSTSDKSEAESDKSKFYSTTARFDEFQRNEVKKSFG